MQNTLIYKPISIMRCLFTNSPIFYVSNYWLENKNHLVCVMLSMVTWSAEDRGFVPTDPRLGSSKVNDIHISNLFSQHAASRSKK